MSKQSSDNTGGDASKYPSDLLGAGQLSSPLDPALHLNLDYDDFDFESLLDPLLRDMGSARVPSIDPGESPTHDGQDSNRQSVTNISGLAISNIPLISTTLSVRATSQSAGSPHDPTNPHPPLSASRRMPSVGGLVQAQISAVNIGPQSFPQPQPHLTIPRACAFIRAYLASIGQDAAPIDRIELSWHQSQSMDTLPAQMPQGFVRQSMVKPPKDLWSNNDSSLFMPAIDHLHGMQTMKPARGHGSVLDGIPALNPSTSWLPPLPDLQNLPPPHTDFDQQKIPQDSIVQIMAPPKVEEAVRNRISEKRARMHSRTSSSGHTPTSADGQTPPARRRTRTARNAKSMKAAKLAEQIYDEDLAPTPFPYGWQPSEGSKFKYNELGELSDAGYSKKRLKTFITEHPILRDPDASIDPQHPDKGKMVLWLQIVPTDARSRYRTSNSHRCRFQDCPIPRNTLGPGHLQVTFDEKWTIYGDDADPFCNAGSVHLYCLERYLNLPKLCQLPNICVRVDDRNLPYEHLAVNKMKPSDTVQSLMRRFIKACENHQSEAETARALERTEFKNYPLSSHEKNPDFRLVYKSTLNFHCQKDWTHRKRDGSSRKVFERHMGDLQVFQEVQARSNKSAVSIACGDLRRSPRAHPSSPWTPNMTGAKPVGSLADIDEDNIIAGQGNVGLVRRSSRVSPKSPQATRSSQHKRRRDSVDSIFGAALQGNITPQSGRSTSVLSNRQSEDGTPRSILKDPGTPRSKNATAVKFADASATATTSSSVRTTQVPYGEPDSPSRVPSLQNAPNPRKRKGDSPSDARDATRRRYTSEE